MLIHILYPNHFLYFSPHLRYIYYSTTTTITTTAVLGGSSGFGFGDFNNFGLHVADTIKSDYEQERLMQQMMSWETLHLRIKRGK